MKVSVLKQMIAGLDDNVDIWFQFKPNGHCEYDLEPKKSIIFGSCISKEGGPEYICNAIIGVYEK